MSTGRKWLFRFFLLGFIALVTMGLWLPPIITHAVEKDYHFPEVDIDATVLPNGDLLLEETRTFDFQNGPFTYAYFNVDDPLDHLRDFTIAERLDDGTEVQVAPDDAYHSIATEGFQSRWSYSAEDETRTWVFRYRVACAVDVYSDTAHLSWQFIGSGWDKPTRHAVITVHLPGRTAGQIGLFPRRRQCNPERVYEGSIGGTPLTRDQVRAFGHGPLNGEVTFIDPQTIRYEVSDVPPLSYVEGSILFPAGAVPTAVATDQPGLQRILHQERVWADEANARRERHETERGWVLYLLIGVPVALALLVLLARYRDRVPGVPKILEQPPEEDPVQGSVLWSAWQGPLAAERVPGTGAQARAPGRDRDEGRRPRHRSEGPDARPEDGRDGSPERARPGLHVAALRPRRGRGRRGLGQPPEASEGGVVGHLRGVVVRREVEVQRHHPPHPQGRRAARIDAGGDHRDRRRGLRDLDRRLGPRRRDRVVARPGLGDQPDRGPGRDPREARARGPDPRQALEAFRTYLKDFSDLPNAPALAVVIWEQYLEWAVALGVANEVEKQVKALVPVESLRSPIRGAPTGLAGLTAWQHFQSAAPTLVLVSMASASSGSSSGGFGSSSSFSGFSGGGFSGGGAGEAEARAGAPADEAPRVRAGPRG